MAVNAEGVCIMSGWISFFNPEATAGALHPVAEARAALGAGVDAPGILGVAVAVRVAFTSPVSH